MRKKAETTGEEKKVERKIMRVKLKFTESVLGTCASNEELYRDYIGSKAPDAASVDDEVAALGTDAVVEKAMTVFPRTENGVPFLYDYQIKGYFKDTCGGMRRIDGSESSKVKAFKKEIDKLIFPMPRQIVFENYEPITTCQRPLRASTPQGERVSIAISEEIPAGASVTFDIVLLTSEHEALIREWLDYGIFSGIGQWRNSGHGRFTWEELT